MIKNSKKAENSKKFEITRLLSWFLMCFYKIVSRETSKYGSFDSGGNSGASGMPRPTNYYLFKNIQIADLGVALGVNINFIAADIVCSRGIFVD